MTYIDQPIIPIKELLELVCIDKNKIYIDPESFDTLNCEFEITPIDFIHYAELDLQENNERGLVNCLSNSKRAIDAEVDKVLICLGLYSRRLNFPQKMDKLRQLGIITPRILSKVIARRNYLEHEFKTPDKEQVEDAIDVANLFILTIDNILENFSTNFYIYNDFPEGHEFFNPDSYYGHNSEKTIRVEFDIRKKPLQVEVEGWIFDKNSEQVFSDRPVRFIGKSFIKPEENCFTRILAMGYKSYRSPHEYAILYENLLNSL